MNSDLLLANIGPQRRGESLLARRVRFHQSWYRVAILGLPQFGRTAGSGSQPLGSVLIDSDALNGCNFTCLAAQKLYLRRRSEGWGVDPIRCTKYLTSSQALTLNLLGPLCESSAWFARVLAYVLGRPDILAVEQIWVEFAPRRRSQYLNDMTRVDALVMMQTSRGGELLAVEIKYADRFNSRCVDIDTPPYHDLAQSLNLWTDADRTLLSPDINQLVRCHALTAAVSRDIFASSTPVPGVLILHHEADKASRAVSDSYRSHLNEPSLLRNATLTEFIAALGDTAKSAAQREKARTLQLRYITESESEAAWISSRSPAQ